MYERSAMVLERYYEKIFGFNKENNLRTNYEIYQRIIEEVKEYQKIVEEEENMIGKFDEVAIQIQEIQKAQAKLHELTLELEKERNILFNDLGENPNTLDNKLQKIESKIEENNEELKELREKYVKALVIFTERQKERNKYARIRRTAESNYMGNIESANKIFEQIDIKDAYEMKKFSDSDKKEKQQEIINIMIKNGKNEKVAFNHQVIQEAVEVRMSIAEKEAELYVSIYEKMKRLLNDLNSENIRLGRAEKLLRDVSVKLAFLEAEKDYIVGFLDNERMTSIHGKKAHEKLMEEACKNFKLDITQIHQLYELILRETTGKSTKKAYKELYNKTYLKDIQEKEKNFEEAVTNIKIKMGTVINSNYWRIEGIKNVYNVFQEEISEKFNKDLSKYKIEEIEDQILPEIKEERNQDYVQDNDKEYEDDKEYDKEDEEVDESEYEEEENDEEDDSQDYDEEEQEVVDMEQEEEEQDELVEDKIDQIIRDSRKQSIYRKEDKTTKGLWGKLFKK
ncbi:MAG: hypothetical protein HFJ37_00515 [Clostridia bacterium]|nr:hypothetical protein [Clostridia bacterium]